MDEQNVIFKEEEDDEENQALKVKLEELEFIRLDLLDRVEQVKEKARQYLT